MIIRVSVVLRRLFGFINEIDKVFWPLETSALESLYRLMQSVVAVVTCVTSLFVTLGSVLL